MVKILFDGMVLNFLMATGNNTKPDDIILIEATWNAVRLSNPFIIKIKLLPQITDNVMNINQLINLLFIITAKLHIKFYLFAICCANFPILVEIFNT